jgi:hypothetical protein
LSRAAIVLYFAGIAIKRAKAAVVAAAEVHVDADVISFD